MEELMSEVTEQILSSEPSTLTVPNLQRRLSLNDLPQTSTDINSVALMRLSLTSYVRDAYSKTKGIDDNKTKQNKSKKYDDPFIKRPKVDVQFLNSKLTSFTPKTLDSVSKKEDPTVTQEANESDSSKEICSKQIRETEVSDPEMLPKANAAEPKAEDEDAKISETKSVEDIESSRKTVENGIKLARRQSPENIFENCSTYELACSQVVFEKKNMPSEEDSKEEVNSSIEEEHSWNGNHFSEGANEIFTNSMVAEDQISLSDSFFASVNSDEFSSNNSSFSAQSSVNTSMSQESASASYSAHSDVSEYTDVSYNRQNGAHMRRSKEQKLSKKQRKKQKKDKSKDVPKYTCPKCGVSYILSSNVAARCLHCDFWTSVEPEFLKRGKVVWKTCRVC